MLVLVDYGLILLFFLGVLLLVLIIARPHKRELAGQKGSASLNTGAQGRGTVPPSLAAEQNISFVVLMLFFLLLVLVAFIRTKQQARPSSPVV